MLAAPKITGPIKRTPSWLDPAYRIAGGERALCRLLGCTRIELWCWRVERRLLPASGAERLLVEARQRIEEHRAFIAELERRLPLLRERERSPRFVQPDLAAEAAAREARAKWPPQRKRRKPKTAAKAKRE